MKDLEYSLGEDQFKRIKMELSTKKFFSNKKVIKFMNDLETLEDYYTDFMLNLRKYSAKYLKEKEQLKSRRYIIVSLEKILENPLDALSVMDKTREIITLDNTQFRERVIDVAASQIKKIYGLYRELLKNQNRLSNAEYRRFSDLNFIIRNIEKYYFHIQDNEKEQAEAIIQSTIGDFMQENEAHAGDAIVSGLVDYLESMGLEVKVTSRGIDTSKPYWQLHKLKEAKKEEVITAIKSSQANPKKIETASYEYVFDGKPRYGGKLLDAYAIGQDFLRDFITFGEKVITTNRQKDALAVARQMVIDKKFPGYEQVKSVLSKDRKIKLDTLTERFQREGVMGEEFSNLFNIYDKSDFSWLEEDKFFQEKLPQSGLYLLCRDILITDLLDGIGMLGKDFRKFYDDIALFWHKFSPNEFDLKNLLSRAKIEKIESNYRIAVKRNTKILSEAVKTSGACLTENNISAFTQDPATINLIGYNVNNPMGYTRMFLTTNKKNELGLALDTIEIGHKNFLKNSDWIRVMTLAANQLCLDSGLRFVVGSDARISYGARQGFGNKAMPIKLKKLGDPNFELYDPLMDTRSNSIGFDNYGFHVSESTYLLMQNWRKNLNGKL